MTIELKIQQGKESLPCNLKLPQYLKFSVNPLEVAQEKWVVLVVLTLSHSRSLPKEALPPPHLPSAQTVIN